MHNRTQKIWKSDAETNAKTAPQSAAQSGVTYSGTKFGARDGKKNWARGFNRFPCGASFLRHDIVINWCSHFKYLDSFGCQTRSFRSPTPTSQSMNEPARASQLSQLVAPPELLAPNIWHLWAPTPNFIIDLLLYYRVLSCWAFWDLVPKCSKFKSFFSWSALSKTSSRASLARHGSELR